MLKPQTPSIGLQTSFGLAAWLLLAPVAEALPTYTPIPLDIPTPQADARFAEAVAGIGDVNGDGVPDFLVGAPFFQILGNLNQGRVLVFSGADRSLLLTLDNPIPQQGLALFGSAVAGAGDVNGDGRPDLLVGAPEQTVAGRANQGQAYVFSGADGRLLRTLDNPFPQADAAFGAALAGIGDVNGDGLPDLLVGAPEQNEGIISARGQAFVFSGADASLLLTLDDPPSPGDLFFGSAVAGAGDVNGDGKPDLLVGTDFGQRAFVFSGVDGSVLRTLVNPQGGSFRGPVAGIGDVNSDGVPDFLVGAPIQIVAGIVTGRAFVFNGADASLLRLLDNPNPSGFAGFGSALSAAGDVNGDGVPDLLVGAAGQGRAFVFNGADASLLLTLTADSSGGFGEVVAGIGDVDGDGAPDFLVGAPDQSVGGRFRQGRAFVVVSVALGLARTQVPCTSTRCRVSARCDLPAGLGSACRNPLRLLVEVPSRLAEEVAGTRQRRLRVFAVSNATNVPPGQTENVRLRLTPLGRRIFNTTTVNRLRGVLEIRNTPGTVIDTTRVRIRLRRR